MLLAENYDLTVEKPTSELLPKLQLKHCPMCHIVFRLHSIQCIGTNYVSPIFCGDHPPHESNLKHSIFILPGQRPDPWLENAMPSLL